MSYALVLLSIALGLATFVAQLVGWQRSIGSWRQSLVRFLVFLGWGALLLLGLFFFVFFHYCEHNCTGELNPLALPIFIAILALNFGVMWLGLRGFGTAMVYEFHITRRADWADDRGEGITLDEWIAYVASDPEMKPDPHHRGPENAIYVGAREEWPFRWVRRGEILTNNPTPDVIVKMLAIARKLGAKVQGHGGETYGFDSSHPTHRRDNAV